MDIENPVALHFLMQDDLFFLNKDKQAYNNARVVEQVAEEVAVKEVIAVVAEPAAEAPVIPPVVVEEIVIEAETPAPVEYNHSGKRNGLLVIVHYPNLEFINETHLTALENILKRTGVAIDDVAILNMATHGNAGFESISTYFNPQKILLLGKDALPAGIAPLKLNTPQALGNSKALYSFSFDEMMDSPENKKAFWEQMKLL